jgi:site-specific DNA recombinase
MESAWSNGRAAYRCRHGHTSAARPDPGRPGNTYVREDRALAQLRALHMLLSSAPAGGERRRRTRHGVDARRPASLEEAISYLRENEITLTYDQAAATLRAGGAAKTITTKAS